MLNSYDVRRAVAAGAVAAGIVLLFRGVLHEVFRLFAPLARPWLLDALTWFGLALLILRPLERAGGGGAWFGKD